MSATWADREHLALVETMTRMTEAAPGGRVERRGGEVVGVAAHPFAFLDLVMRTDAGDARGLLARAEETFAALGREWTAFVHPGDESLDAAARELELEMVRLYPQMVCPRRLEEPAPGPGVEVRVVEDEAAAADYWRVCARAYESLGFPAAVFEGFARGALLGDDRRGWIASVDGRPAATAMVVLAQGVGTVVWVAALEEHRGCGLARLCTTLATNGAYDLGAEVAALQASPMGEPVYLRMGYEEAYRYRLYRRRR